MLQVSRIEFQVIEQVVVRGECPSCHAVSNFSFKWMTPRSEVENLYNRTNGVRLMPTATVWSCDSCLAYVYIEWELESPRVPGSSYSKPRVINFKSYRLDDEFAPEDVKEDLTEALKCLSLDCFNAFAAMCRRTIQTICNLSGASATTKVGNQLTEFKQTSGIDPGSDDANALDAIVLTGHDGAHPHLPRVDQNRAKMLLILIQDIIDQIYNRPGRISKAKELRSKKIEEHKAQG